MLANGAQQYANQIYLRLGGPNHQYLHLEISVPGVIGGRMDAMVVPLPSGATLALPIDLSEYSAPKEGVWSLKLSPGRYALTAEYKGFAVPQSSANLDMKGISVMPFWTGVTHSNTLSFTVNADVPNPK